MDKNVKKRFYIYGRWRGSIYKLLWKDFLLYVALYYVFTVIYHVILSETQRRSIDVI